MAGPFDFCHKSKKNDKIFASEKAFLSVVMVCPGGERYLIVAGLIFL